MDEIKIPEMICGYLNGMGGDIPFIPETWREDSAAVWLTGGAERIREYIDGSAVIGIPFEIRVRCAGRAVSDRLDAVRFFTDIAEYIVKIPMDDGSAKIEITGGAAKSAVYDNGEEEYRAAYRLTKYCRNI